MDLPKGVIKPTQFRPSRDRISNVSYRTINEGIDYLWNNSDELAKHVAQIFLTLKMAGNENTVSTPIYKLSSAHHRVV